SRNFMNCMRMSVLVYLCVCVYFCVYICGLDVGVLWRCMSVCVCVWWVCILDVYVLWRCMSVCVCVLCICFWAYMLLYVFPEAMCVCVRARTRVWLCVFRCVLAYMYCTYFRKQCVLAYFCTVHLCVFVLLCVRRHSQYRCICAVFQEALSVQVYLCCCVSGGTLSTGVF